MLDFPWCRCYVVMDRGAREVASVPLVRKPFDAAGFARELEREHELAALDRRRHALEARTEELAQLVQNSFEAIIGLDRDFNIISWNPGAQAIYGYSQEEVLGRPISILGDDFACASRALEPAAKHVVETVRRTRSGAERAVLLSRSRANSVHPGARLAYAELSLDVTERRKLEKELEHARRLAHLGRVATTISHELNNPLAVVRSCASWLSNFCTQVGDQELLEVANDLELAADRIHTFSGQIAGFARRSDGDFANHPLFTTIEMALRLIRPRAGTKRVRIHLGNPDAALHPVWHNPSRLAHAIINITANAIDAASQGGGNVWFEVSIRSRHAVITVSDDGPGISKEVREHLFEPFTTTKPLGEGTGLGLALTRQIALEHAGRVELSARAEGGAVCVLSLPLKKAFVGGEDSSASPLDGSDSVAASSLKPTKDR